MPRAPADSEAHTKTLICVLLAGASSDVEVVRRDLCLCEQMIERLQRALDRLGCAQSILEAAGTRRLENSGSAAVGTNQGSGAGACGELAAGLLGRNG